jgi:hypothetical protein
MDFQRRGARDKIEEIKKLGGVMRNHEEKELLGEIKKTLLKIAEKDPGWRLMLGRESLSATEVIERLGSDKKLKTTVVKHYVGLAIEIEKEARNKLEDGHG